MGVTSRAGAVPMIGFCGRSGSGKTTLARRVIGLLGERRLRVGVLKQARDDFDVDRPGKDSDRLRRAGVERLLLGSERQSALIDERAAAAEPDFAGLIAEFDTRTLDVILVEGFADADIPKIELLRGPDGRRDARAPRPPRYPYDRRVIAVAAAAAAAVTPPPRQPRLDADDPWAVTDFICRALALDAAPPERPL